MGFKLKEELTKLITKGSVKTNYFDAKDRTWRDNTPKFDKYLKSKGFKKGSDYKIEDIAPPSKSKQRFIWLKGK